ncbi:hypothetical protein J2T12_001003 [Paenibacillus anaericanus]|nr:hypothetical protein [Paenibacillus anaericanus]
MSDLKIHSEINGTKYFTIIDTLKGVFMYFEYQLYLSGELYCQFLIYYLIEQAYIFSFNDFSF